MSSPRNTTVLAVFVLFALVLTVLPASVTCADDDDPWVLLGERRVSDRAEHDTIHVGVKRGRFEAIQIRVLHRAVQFHDLKIHFENGDVQDVALRSVIRAGQRSRAIDLEGGRRAIDRIVFFYDAQTRRRHRGAAVRVFGRR